MKYFADLHLHSIYSDGTFTPTEVVQKAHELGFSTISLTDHDIIEGLPEAIDASKRTGLELIPGVELSVDQDKMEVHILGYFIHWESPYFVHTLKDLEARRIDRLHEMLRRLARLGFHLESEDVMAQNCCGTVGRVHVAQALVHKGILPSVGEAFRLYLGYGRTAYVEKAGITLEGAIELVIKAGGIPVMAHPGLTATERLIPRLAKIGLRGVEAFHPSHSLEVSASLVRLANRLGLLITGGSDCHGMAKEEVLMGKVRLEKKYVDLLKAEHSSH